MRIQSISNYNFSPIRFKGEEEIQEAPKDKDSILEKYGINPDEIDVVASSDDIAVGGAEKQELIKKILEAHDLARKNYQYGNITNRAFATNLCLTDGTWHLGTNFNNTRGALSSICGERTALLGAYNSYLMNKPEVEDANRKDLDFKVKYLAMSSHKPLGEDRDASCPCAECLSWFDTPRYFSDDTVIASLQRDDSGKLDLVLSKLSDYLPQRKKHATAPLGPIQKLPVKMTDKAREVAIRKNITSDDIRNQLATTTEEYDLNAQTETSGQNIAASVFANNRVYAGTKIDFTKRWYIEPLELAAAKAIEDNGNDTHIDIVCYVGDEIKAPTSKIASDRVVNIKVLGELTSKFADKDTLVISTRSDKVDVKTIGDYMPDKFRFKNGYHIA